MDEQLNEIEQDAPHTAITSYSGYIYQGKISLLHCLKLIERQPTESRTLKLQIESIEDFAILNTDNTCKSLHQVKARKDRLFSDYRPDVEKLRVKANLQFDSEAFFHVSLTLRLIPNTFTNDYFPVTFYQYYDTNDNPVDHCPLGSVDTFIEHQINKVYQVLCPNDAYRTNNEYLLKSRQFLEDIIIKHVIDVHREIQENRVPGAVQRQVAASRYIVFDNFFEILTENLNNRGEDESYFHYLLLKDAGTYFHDYCQRLGVNNENTLLKLNYYFSKFNALNPSSLTKFIRAIVPHKKVGFNNISQYKDNTFNRDDFKRGLLKVLDQLAQSEFDESLQLPSLFFWKNDDEYLYPTAIHHHEKEAEDLCVEIIEASIADDVNFLFEGGKLVNRYINCQSIFSNIAVGNQSEFNLEDEFSDELNENRINSFRNVSLISIAEAQRVIND
ncbi:MAG: hypothetical protein OFPII_35870 [Osedax symbiont Rs1]|nr:MAG: hypothetical protein OFPII_35870 [Osedax symbiont Rs1]